MTRRTLRNGRRCTRAATRLFASAGLVTLLGTARADPQRPYPPLLDTEARHAPPTVRQQHWALATNALLTESNRGRHDVLGGNKRTPAQIAEWREVLRRSWRIENRDDLLRTLEWLRAGGHRREFDETAALLARLTPNQIDQLREHLADNPQALNRIEIVFRHRGELGDKSIAAWDFARYIYICGFAWIAGYIEEDEAWRLIMPVARMLQRTFDSWEDLGRNHLIGREFWSLSATQRRGHEFRQSFRTLLDDARSPWRTLPWDLDLAPPEEAAPPD